MSGPLTDADRAALAAWVSPAYLDPASWGKIQAKFEADGSVQLQVGGAVCSAVGA